MLIAAVLIASLAVDQVGYPAYAPKLAVVSVAPPTSAAFTITRGGKVVYEGKLTEPQFDPDTRNRVSVADFSSITEPGQYEIQVGDERSAVTIANDPYRDVLNLTMRAFTGLRCGTAVDLGGGFAHPACHTGSPAAGGWHDAGDYGRYVVNSGISTGTLLWAVEMFGLDMRDEIRWNVDWMMRMQDADGSVWVKETSKDFAPFIMPQDDHSEQLLIGKSSCAAADFAAVTAIAARVYKSQAYLDASKRAWQWVSANPDVTFRNPPGILTGEYGDSDCSDERAWAGAELFRTTGDASYAGSLKFPVGVPSWKNVGPLASWTYAMSANADPNIAAEIRTSTIAAADEIVQRTRRHAYRIPMQTADYVWGSNGVAANYGVLLLVANRFHRSPAYVDAALETLHYLLGRNPFSMSWVTGTGSTSTMHPHHRPSAADNVAAPWPGLLAGGPNGNRQDAVLARLPAGTPPALLYADQTESYASNEVAINWNAALVFDLAGIRSAQSGTSKRRIVAFRAAGFPTVDAPPIPDDVFAGYERTDDLRNLAGVDVLVLPYGSAFPLDSWTSIRDYLKRGGDLVVLGGAPFHQPVLRTANGWQLGTRQPTFARELLIGPAEPVKFDGKTVWELTIRLGTKPEIPGEWGSQSIVDAHVVPLEQLKDADGIARACPLVEIDHDKGGKWIFATSDEQLSAEKIAAIVALLPRPAGEKVAEGRMRGQFPIPKGPRITVSKDWLRKDGKVFPIVGTTYMASDVHRAFLFQPNPRLWDEDFALMEKSGINFVRTGLWTGWDKAHGEDFYKALDAYVAAAAKHDIIVCFTFFAFQPLWAGGTNPFLDPRSIAKQRELVTTIARRYKGAGWIHYDLINEPSYAPADKLWQNRPIGDEWEKRAWREWVHEHRGDGEAELRNLWHEPGDIYALPGTPQKTFDFTLFTNDAVAKWAKTLRDAIHAEDPEALVTLGQDEGGTGTRPSQQLHADSVDYTSTHPWWQNDDVLPNGLFAKVQEKPMLFQETGLMRLEDWNGNPWRTPERAAELLDRKFAYAFMSRGAGAIEWAWNINPYMPDDNESVIGLFRPDGTAKPEFDVVRKFAEFFKAAAPYLDDYAPDPVVIVIPQSKLFMNRPAALDGYRRAVKVLAERFAVVPTAISDLRLTPDRLRDAKLVIVPSAEFLSRDAVAALATAKNVLYTGVATENEPSTPVRLHEGSATFDRDLQEALRRVPSPPQRGGEEPALSERSESKGGRRPDEGANATHEPLPLEYAREDEPLVALFARALNQQPFEKGVAMRVLEMPRARLVIAVNETAAEAKRHIGGIDVTVPAGRSTLALVDRATGSEVTRR